MKKLVFLGAMVMIVGGVALASSVTVPFFNDEGDLGWPPANGKSASFISLTNNTDGDLTLWVTYTNDAGVDMTPTNNSFLLKKKSAIGFRPVADDPNEGPTTGQLVPNADIAKAGNAKWGSAIISWDGTDTTAVQGRLMQINSPTTDTGMYTLPAGK